MVAALERFMRETAPAAAEPPARPDPWLRAALHEAASRDPDEPGPWGDPTPWG